MPVPVDHDPELLKLAPNIYNEPICVWHSQLARSSDESLFKSHCPCCPVGILPVTRDNRTLHLARLDRCISCGQHFIYQDDEIAREPLPPLRPVEG